MNDLPMPGPLDDFLDRPPVQPASAALRDALLQRTAALVRRRRRLRVLAAAGAIAAVVVIAAIIVWTRLPRGAQPREEQPLAREQPPPAPAAEKPAMPTAVALEWQAFDAPPEQRTALYRQAGDRYVEDADDLASAVRCYGQAIRTASAAELAIAHDDNWLVRALKIDEIERRKEQ